MQNKFFLVITIFMLFLPAAHAKSNDANIQAALNTHHTTYKDQEYFSGIALAVYQPNHPIKSYYVGHVSHEPNSEKISGQTLFEIGSITKSFTAALLLQLEKENKLHLTDTLKIWQPNYPKWSSISLASLLNMTSGLPNYSDAPLLNGDVYKDIQRVWTQEELLSYVYPPAEFTPALRAGYFYTNTGYILAERIIEKITGRSFKHEIETRLFQAAELHDSFYPIPNMTPDVIARLAHGYAYNPYTNPEMLGRDMQLNSMTWAGAAGAIISTPADVIRWTKALFIDNKILDAAQKAKLKSLVSTTTGKPLKQTSPQEPRGFGLGVSQGYDKKFGKFWFYEGETEGFRALFMYVPVNGIIISAIFNSAVNGENDHAGELMNKIYSILTL